MRRFINFLIFLLIVGATAVYLFFYRIDIEKKLYSNYYLLFHSNISINDFQKDNIFPWKFEIEGISGKDFFISKIKCNLITKTLEIYGMELLANNDKYKNIISDLKYINFPINKINIISANIAGKDFLLKKLFGQIIVSKSGIASKMFGYLNNFFTSINGGVNNFKDVVLNINFSNVSLNNLVKVLNIPVNFPKNYSNIQSVIRYFGQINGKLQKEFKLVFDNNTFVGFLNSNEVATNIYNAKIILPDKNEVGFSGQFISPQNYKIFLKSKGKVSGKYKDITFNNVNFELLYERNLDNKQESFNIVGDSFSIPDSSIFFDNLKYSNISIKLQQLKIADTILNNVDISTTVFNSKVSYNKVNFDIDDGSFIFSLIPEIDSNPLQVAADVKNINLKKFFKLFNLYPIFNGNFNCSFIAEGENGKFNNGKGYFFIENFIIKGINLDNISKELSENNIVNFSYIYDNSSTNFDNNSYSTKFDLIKGFVKPYKNSLKFYKLSLMSKKGLLLLNGDLNLKDYNNLILQGILKTKEVTQNIIINLNFDKKIVQIIKK